MPTDLPLMWKEMLTLCNLRADESVVALTRQGSSSYARIATQAAEAMGAHVSSIEAADPSALPAAALAAIGRANLLLDFAFSHDGRVAKLLGEGLRTLVTVEPPEILARMFPTEEDKRRCLAGEQRLRTAATMRVVSPAGTDFALSLGEFRSSCQYGFADQPGRWDQWPGAFVYSYPNERSANGTVVLDRGDILFPQKSYIQAPIRLTIRNGYITDIEGGPDAKNLADTFKSFNDAEVYAISHVGWGLSHNSKWDALDMFDKADIEGQDGRAFYGNFLFSTGPNALGGGKRETPCHIDAPMRNCSLYLDDEPIVIDGDVIPVDQKAGGNKP
jgi:2,5-dihydroxypyridine 5,6-dioxygenase